ncbi:MAG: hypothetical protein SGJ21_07095 [Alphaproteobacteria bacterium]|nr:hypothetical protein [Alphaproteobacteria bacterium]
MNHRLKLAAGAIASSLLLGACDGGGNSFTPPPPPPGGSGPQALEDRFGAGFGILFRALPFSDPPGEPMASTVVSVDVTADAIPVP